MRKKKWIPTQKLESKTLWKAFSEYIRLRDSNEFGFAKCPTCGEEKFWRQMDAGHFIPKGKAMVKYDERNVHAQCKRCNGPMKGRPYEYSLFIDAKYGEGTAKELFDMRDQERKFYRPEVLDMIAHYKEQSKILLNAKNFAT